ncbi:sulfate ABC transporter substrate-binding protein [Phormidesmis priestleyi ULC007]|uniref:Sulfate ABC transporter substrate-binding protein n=1 Tax=Phormidesmis priestleyi ULC007 TaxID=1920490 RepID=A0A2T1DNB8_9CYAN|nr:sulfate ABC transporter substrate-binding protein [Phormidesmis priestleyi]PSB21914.1 sulfate ABC transporter substrate-binding protein [Phormidesmis priestleyi ULC007]PZO46755.1 MAG: sulfate ABC transporter substrate-binding protein [Phormidesmis priestleyi]
MRVWQRALTGWRQLTRHLINQFRLDSIKSFASLFIIGATLSVAIAACSNGSGNNSTATSPAGSPVAQNQKDVELTLVGYAIPKIAYDAIIPKFVEQWKKDHGGQTVTFNQSYGGSGTQTRAVIDGLEADVVHLALAGDTNKLVKAGLVNADWDTKVPNNGIVAKTVAAITTREGNPKNIKSFNDLARDGVKWVTANPKTSGVARWNFLALWNASIKSGADEAKATEFVTQAFKNVAVLTKDAREATDAFSKQGQGDALINYENEIILAKSKGEKLEYTIPEVNISIDTPIAVVDKNVDKHGTREAAEGFVKFLFTPEAQQEFINLGYRPLDAAAAAQKENTDKFPPVKTLSTIKDFGGWTDFQKKFFEDGAIFDQIEASINK